MIELIFAAALAGQADAAAPVPAAILNSAPPSEGVTDYPRAFFVSANPSNAFDMIARLPGFTFDGGEVVRGFASATGNVLIDGKRPTSKASTLQETLSRIPAESVVRIELIRGGAPGIDMQGRTLIANVVRSTATVTERSAIFQLKSFPDEHVVPRGEFLISQRKGGLVWSAGLIGFSELDNTMGDGTQTRRDRTGAIYESGILDIDSKQFTYQGTFDGELTRANDVIRLNASLKRNGQGYDDAVDIANNVGRRISIDRSLFDYYIDRGEIGGDYTRTLPNRMTFRVLGLQVLTKDERDGFSAIRGNNTVVKETGKGGESIVRATLNKVQSASLTLEAGGEAAFNFLDASSARVVNGVTQVLPNANVRIEEKRAEGFAKASFRPTPALSAEFETRVETSEISQTGDTNSAKKLFFVKPRALITYKVTPSTELRLRFEREVGQLNFKDFAASSALDAGTVNVGNANLVPENTWVAETTLEKRFWGRGAFVLTYTRGWISDAVDVVPINGAFDAPGNIGSGTREALFASLTVPLDRLGVKGGLLRAFNTWRRSEVTDPVTLRTRRISAEPPNFFQFRFSQDLPKHNMVWGIDGNMRMQDTSYRINEIRANVKREFLILYTEWRPRPDTTIRAEITNPTNRQRLRYRQQFVGPRSANVLSYDERRVWTYGPTFALRARRTF